MTFHLLNSSPLCYNNKTTQNAPVKVCACGSMEEAVLNTSLVTSEWLLDNVTTTAVTPGCRRILTTMEHLVITSTYAVGILGNIAALAILSRIEKKHRKAHTLMLQCLASNDLVALVGMLVLMHLHQYLPRHLACSHAVCVVRVIWRMFGLSSGCVAIVMAVERWLALTHPFLYQKHITYHVIRRAIFFLWAAVVVLVSLPLLGFGLYYEPSTSECVRYRQAKKPMDIAYAYLFFTFGVLLCICIVWCNLAVIRVLCHMGCRGSKRAMLGRRISRNSGRLRSSLSSGSSSNTATTVTTTMLVSYNASTPEEVAFARLMAVLCIGFVACWMPQMITILLAQFAPKSRFSKPFFKLADILILLHFTLDPFIYVLLRCQRRSCFPNVFKILCHACLSHHGGNGSQQTSIAMTDNEHCPSLDPSGEPTSEVDRATAAAV